MNEIAGEEDNQEWGLSMFGDQVRLICFFHVYMLFSEEVIVVKICAC